MTVGPLVSVVVPVYNGENYVEHAIHSILSQTYTNLQIIVVDDGSDNPAFLDSLVSSFNDPRIELHRQKNGGVASALNFAISKMRGEFLAWLSHDDLFSKEKIETQVNCILETQSEDSILFSGYSIINENGRHQAEVDFSSELVLCERLGGLERGLINGCTVFISKRILDEVGEFDENLRYTQDYDYWLRCISAGKNFRYIAKSLVSTRIHSMQDSNQHKHSAKRESELLWLKISKIWLSKERRNLQLDLRESQIFRAFLNKNGFSLAEQNLNEYLLDRISHLKVSVIVPYFNRPFLAKIALGSLKAQLHQNIELILIDDNSILDISLSNFLNDYPVSTKVFKNSENLGAGQSRNIGIANCSGDYICFLDSDDFFLPDKIFEQLVQMIANDSEFSHTNYFSRDSVDNANRFHDTSQHNGYEQSLFIINNGCTIASPTVMLRRSLLDKVRKPFPQTKKAGEDIAAWITLLHNSSSPLLHIHTPLTVVRFHADSAARNVVDQINSKDVIGEAVRDLGIHVNLKSSNPEPNVVLVREAFKKKLMELNKKFSQKILDFLFSCYCKLPINLRTHAKNMPMIRRAYQSFRKFSGF